MFAEALSSPQIRCRPGSLEVASYQLLVLSSGCGFDTVGEVWHKFHLDHFCVDDDSAYRTGMQKAAIPLTLGKADDMMIIDVLAEFGCLVYGRC